MNRIAYLRNELREGNTACLKEVFEKHGDYCIQNLIRKTGCSPQMAEDIFIDAIINFRDKLLADKISYLTSIRAYVYSTCINMYKASQYQKGRFENKKQDIESSLYEAEDQDYLSVTIAKEEQEELMRLSQDSFNALDDRCRSILRFFYVDNYDMKEIARRMEFANKDVAKTIKSRCFKKWSKLVESFTEKKV